MSSLSSFILVRASWESLCWDRRGVGWRLGFYVWASWGRLRQQSIFANAAWVCCFELGYKSRRVGLDSRVGGVMTLVKKGIPCYAWRPELEQGGQALGVHFGATTLVNCYTSPHRGTRRPFLSSLFELAQAFCQNNLGMVGDFNKTRQDTQFVQALETQSWCLFAPEDPGGSRWDQEKPRTIDYVLSKFILLSNLSYRPETWSDHRAFTFQLQHKCCYNCCDPELSMVGCNTYLPKDAADTGAWTQHLQRLWVTDTKGWEEVLQQGQNLVDNPQEVSQQTMDDLWKSANACLDKFLLSAARQSPVEMKTTKKPHCTKNGDARFKKTPVVFCQRYDEHIHSQRVAKTHRSFERS